MFGIALQDDVSWRSPATDPRGFRWHQESALSGPDIGRLALAAAAQGAVFSGVGLAALGAGRDRAFAFTRAMEGEDFDRGQGKTVGPGLPYFFQEGGEILIGFGLAFVEPVEELRPGSQLGRIDKNPLAAAAGFVVEGQGKFPQIHDLEPLVAHRAGGQHLNGIGQAAGGFAKRVVKDAIREVPAGSYAIHVYRGPMEEIGAAWGSLIEWVMSNGYQPVLPAMQVFNNDMTTSVDMELRIAVQK